MRRATGYGGVGGGGGGGGFAIPDATIVASGSTASPSAGSCTNLVCHPTGAQCVVSLASVQSGGAMVIVSWATGQFGVAVEAGPNDKIVNPMTGQISGLGGVFQIDTAGGVSPAVTFVWLYSSVDATYYPFSFASPGA